ncbi:MAG: hypothetical protein C5B50_02055 [Verrucomicrobia bacterium]|nr:MAG: hypothetical protein C5B50_02055 [Verrucomicrobiota bacterium]
MTSILSWPGSFISRLFNRKPRMPRPQPALTAPIAEAQPAEDGPRKSILVVDDDPIILKTTGMKLQAAGYKVVTALDGSDAIKIIRGAKPDIVLLDINFPPDVAFGGSLGWDGMQIMAWLCRATGVSADRFIIVTGTVTPAIEKGVRSSGALGLFSKPLDYEGLLITVEQRLRMEQPETVCAMAELEI